MKAGTGFDEYYAGNNPFGYVYGEQFEDYTANVHHTGIMGASVTGLSDVYPKPQADYSWADRVTYNGATATAGEIAAVDAFLAGLVTDGIRSKMVSACAFPPSSLIACFTPVIADYGNTQWFNTGFVIGDLTTGGIKGNGTSKYLQTGVVPFNVPIMTSASGGITSMVSDATGVPAGGEVDIGLGVSPQQFALSRVTSSPHMFGDCWGFTGNDRISAALTSATQACFISLNRTASNAMAMYRASSTSPFGTLVSTSGAQTQTTVGQIPLFCMAHSMNTAAAGFFCTYRMSFCAIHAGLTSSEAEALYNRVVTMRNAFGGGAP